MSAISLLASQKLSQLSQKQGLRLLFALKAGCAPLEEIDILTVGLEREEKQLQATFGHAANRSPQIVVVEGDYGEGKSHLLNYVAFYARKAGFAQVQIVHDKSQEIGLHKPGHLLRRMLHSLLSKYTELGEAIVRYGRREIQRIPNWWNGHITFDWFMQHPVKYETDRYIRHHFNGFLEQLAIEIASEGKFKGLLICLDELENCTLLAPKQKPIFNEVLNALQDLANAPLVILLAKTPSFTQHLPAALSLCTPSLRKELAIELAERVLYLHSIAFQWQPPFSSAASLVEEVWQDVEREPSAKWRTFVQAMVAVLELEEQRFRQKLSQVGNTGLAVVSTPPPQPSPNPLSCSRKQRLRVTKRREILRGRSLKNLSPNNVATSDIRIGRQVVITCGQYQGKCGLVERISCCVASIILPDNSRINAPLSILRVI